MNRYNQDVHDAGLWHNAWCSMWAQVASAARSIAWSQLCAAACRDIIAGRCTRGEAIERLQAAGVPRQVAKMETFGSDAAGGTGPRR